MSLGQYIKKRNFKSTPEPKGGRASSQMLRFVVQQHAASRLHYDFRLEMGGTLKSWAVPKGPSMDPKIKRLAMMVEDHPVDYRNFEGIIPKGNYGAGTVIVWDEGTYESVTTDGKKAEHDRNLRHQLHQGKLKFKLHGSKLNGEFALVKAHGRGDKGWLLMKLNDVHASREDITLQNESVKSGKTLEDLATANDHTSKRSVKKPVKKTSSRIVRKPASKKKSLPQKQKGYIKKILNGLPDQAFPEFVPPMLATLVNEPVNQDGWLYEIKWDGYRALALSHQEETNLKSRNNKSFNDKFYPVHQAIEALNINAILDGEIVVLDESGKSNFGALQNWRSETDGDLVYYVFDMLWINGKDLTELPFTERRKILEQHIQSNDIIRVSDVFDAAGKDFLQSARTLGLEGVMAKRATSIYLPGDRSMDWLKIKTNKRQEVIIGGFTRNDNSSKTFSSLLVGVYKGKKLMYTGKIGTGFTEKMQRDLLKQFTPRIIDTTPFHHEPDVNKPSRFRPNPPKATVTWLKPELICEVSFTEMTTDGVMRHPSFKGMREDKKPHEVVLEQEAETKKVIRTKAVQAQTKKIIKPMAKRERKTLLNPTEKTQVKTINRHALKFTNLSKVYWPKEKFTKRNLLNYYYQVAPYILPYIKDRPQSLNRHPNGIRGKSFYQKDVTGKVPEWIKTHPYHSDSDVRDKEFLVITDEASLLYMVSMGCIEINPWSSTIHKPDHPDWCIIDLDPDKNSFNQVIEAANVTHELLESVGVPSYCKTSGSTGLHIYIPLGAKYTYEQSKEFARVIATLVHQQLPRFTTIERTIKDRKGKMYIDFLQNRSQATLACAYSVRPKPGATVSMPLHWEEVKKGLTMRDFTIQNAVERLQSEGDIFKPVLGKGISIEKVIKALDA